MTDAVSIRDAADQTVPVLTDTVTSVNGATVAPIDVQRVKLGWGPDGAITDLDQQPATEASLALAVARLTDVVAALAATLTVQGTVQGTVEVTNDAGAPLPVAGPLTDAQLRAAAVDVAAAALPLPTGAASEATAEATRTLIQAIRDAVRAEDTAHASGDTGLMMLAVRRDANGPLATPDGDYAVLQVNADGRLKVSALPGVYELVTGTITGSGQTVTCDVARASNIMVHMVAAALTGHNVTFEGSLDSTDGTDGAWFGIQAVRTNANTIETATGTLAATPSYGWELSVNGLAFVRVRSTAHTAGTATWKFQRAPYATEPIPAVQAHAITGSVTTAAQAGTALMGDVGTQVRGNATGAGTIIGYASPAAPAGQSLKAAAGRLLGFTVKNNAAAKRWVKIFNAGSVTMGTTSALFEVGLDPGETLPVGYEPLGAGMSAGIQVAVTAARGLTDATATGLAAGDVTGEFRYA